MNIGKSEFQAGLFLLIAIFLAAVSILTLGRERQIFASQDRYLTTFQDVKGLSEGAPLRLGGITVGRVDKIHFSGDLDDSLVHVEMLVNTDYLDRIREGTRVRLENQGLLGDRYLSLTLSSQGNALPPGSLVRSEEKGDIGEMMQKAGDVVNNVADASEGLKDFLKGFQGEGLEDFNQSLKNLRSITGAIEQGEGFLHELIYSEKGKKQGAGKSLHEATESLANILREIERGDGMIHALIYEPTGRKTLRNFSKAMTEFAQVNEKLNAIAEGIISGDGVLHNFIYSDDDAKLSETLKAFHNTAKNLEKASKALADGQGTLGALLVDSQLYDNLVETTDGAKRSAILRYAIRKSIEKSRDGK